jgi:transposase-like protein
MKTKKITKKELGQALNQITKNLAEQNPDWQINEINKIGKTKIKCPICKSEDTKVEGTVFKCNKCPYLNTNYQNPFVFETADVLVSVPKVKHKLLHKDNISKLDKELINNFYTEILNIWIKTSNKCREEFSPDKKTLDVLSEKFENNLKLFFEMLEEKI